jgi:hypothetical protein
MPPLFAFRLGAARRLSPRKDGYRSASTRVIRQPARAPQCSRHRCTKGAGFRKFSSSHHIQTLRPTTSWTAHESRLARDFGTKRFASEGNAIEELVTELGARFSVPILI